MSGDKVTHGADYVPPPEGWFDFGTHVDSPVRLEFSEEVGEDMLPRWERPTPPTQGRAPESEAGR